MLLPELLLLLPLLEIPEPLLPAARLFVAAKAFELFWLIALAPPVNMYVVTERMVEYNLWLIAERAAHLAAAVYITVTGVTSIGTGIVLYGALSSGLVVLTLVASSVRIALTDRRLVPSPGLANRESLRPLLHIGGWYAAVLVAMSMHLRLGAVIMNLAFGLFGNLIFGLAMTLASYMRMIATGMTTGLDAVTGRLSSSRGDPAVRQLVHHATRLHGLATFPAAVILLVLAEPLLQLWVGGRVEDPATALPPTATLVRVLAIGIAVRSISDGWITVLYGAGYIARYAPVVIIGGIASPLLAVLLLVVLPETVRYTAVAWAFSAVMVVVHGCLVPWIAGRTLGIGGWRLVGALVRPLTVSIAAAPILLLAAWRVQNWTLWHLGATLALFGVVYGLLVVLFVADRHERERFRAAIRGMGRGAGAQENSG